MNRKNKDNTTEISFADVESVSFIEPDKKTDNEKAAESFASSRSSQELFIDDDPFAKDVIDGRYEIVRRLGSGAMGAVFLAKHLRLNKLFALKTVHPNLARAPQFAVRFEREAHACSRLKHPNCISVTDFGQTPDGTLYLVMEYAQGELLSDLIKQGRVSLANALEYTEQILLGLKHAHAEGLIHRDIKPENIVKCTRDDGGALLKILDFGMAKQFSDNPHNPTITDRGLVMGTPQYMAPEQICGEPADMRTDLYAAGVTLFRLIAGKPIFPGASHLDVFEAKTQKPAPTLQEVTGVSYPKELEDFLAKALDRDPANRFSNADDMLKALQTVSETLIEKNTTANKHNGFLGFKFQPKTVKTILAATAAGLIIGVIATITLLTSSDKDDESNKQNVASIVTAPQAANNIASSTDKSPKALIQNTVALSDTEKDQTAILSLADTESSKPHIEKDPLLEQAAVLIERRKCKNAYKLLDGSSSANSAEGKYLSAQSMACAGRNEEALDLYREAVGLDNRYSSDTKILEDVKQMVAKPALRAHAIAFMDQVMPDAALPILIQLAGRHPSREVRNLALKAVQRQGAADRVDAAASLEYEFLQASSCAEKQKIVNKLAALKTKTAAQVLIRARDAEEKVGVFKKRYVNECVRKDIIRALKQMKKD